MTPTDAVEQAKLIPEQAAQLPPVTEVALNDIEPDADLLGDPPSAAFVRSIERLGVIEPVVLVPNGDGRLHVYDGRNRVRASREVGNETIPARIYDRDYVDPQVFTLALNAQRRANPKSDVAAIMELLERGASEKEIAEATGLPLGTLRKRMRLVGLPPKLFAGLMAGELSAAMGHRILRLPTAAQDRLQDVFEEVGKITSDDIDVAKAQSRADAMAQLPADLFAGKGTVGGRRFEDMSAPMSRPGRVFVRFKESGKGGYTEGAEIDVDDVYRALVAYGLLEEV